ncbi:glycosyl hydrolase-related protein [Dactylosporangium sp. NPDC005572]|uniref:glycosyl hydrolase-related protein n=1 Tax=Dactylosporangium sp. NPDC005572 TaxID=3156889 RepID=UPI0033B34A9E
MLPGRWCSTRPSIASPDLTAAWSTDLLERTLDQRTWRPENGIKLDLRPFEIATPRISPAR